MATKNRNGEFAVFSPETLGRLRKAGWTEDRNIGLTGYVAAFAEEDLELPIKVRRFLASFGGLVIDCKTPGGLEDTLDFRADEAVQGLGGTTLRSYEEIIGAGPLSPIGHCAFGTCLLMMTSSGKVYGGVNWRLACLGRTGPDAIENVISGENIAFVSYGPPPKSQFE